ncbi:hypothetical protein H6CHR_05015 [Variovorax sp. PBL-H6]|nr:hypothetical protein H6CHR_05015 [Variovorax sp. PBL-H6]
MKATRIIEAALLIVGDGLAMPFAQAQQPVSTPHLH